MGLSGRNCISLASWPSESLVTISSYPSSLSSDASWLSKPATQKQLDFLYLLKGHGDSGRPKDAIIFGQLVSVRDLSRGQMSALM